MSIIAVDNLHKNYMVKRHYDGLGNSLLGLMSPGYRMVRAVDGISFSIEPGELVGCLGMNGAGKSTLINMLTGLLVPSYGALLVNGYVPWREQNSCAAHIGAVLCHQTVLMWNLPVLKSLETLQHAYRMPPGRFRCNLDKFCALLELDSLLTTPVRLLSLGQRVKADLCAAVLHEPDILFLDEPTDGLDGADKECINQCIRYINHERGVTVLFAARDLSNIEKVCERVIVLDHGHLRHQMSDFSEKSDI